MYDKMNELPNGNVKTLTTTSTSIEIFIEKNKTYYVTIIPFDKHGQKIDIPFLFLSKR